MQSALRGEKVCGAQIIFGRWIGELGRGGEFRKGVMLQLVCIASLQLLVTFSGILPAG